MNKFKKVLIVAACALSTAAGVLIASNDKVFKMNASSNPECEKYWTSGEYTCLNEINSNFFLDNKRDLSYETWGTVTEVYRHAGSSYWCAIFQNYSPYFDKGASILYNFSNASTSPLKVGDFIEVSGKPSLPSAQAGYTQFNGGNGDATYTLLDSVISYGVDSKELTSGIYMIAGTDYYWYEDTISYGLIKSTISDVEVYSEPTDTEVTMTDGWSQFRVFYGQCENSAEIKAKFVDAYNSTAILSLTGFASIYNNNFQLMIKDPSGVRDPYSEFSLDTHELISYNGFSYEFSLSIPEGFSMENCVFELYGFRSNLQVRDVEGFYDNFGESLYEYECKEQYLCSFDFPNLEVYTDDYSFVLIAYLVPSGSPFAATEDYCFINPDNMKQYYDYISFSPNSYLFNALNKTYTPTLVKEPQSVKNGDITYTTSNSNVATVSNSGVVTSVGDGTCTITATAPGNITSTLSITVDSSLEGLTSKYYNIGSASIGTYATNFGSKTYNSVSFDYYRVGPTSSGAIEIFPASTYSTVAKDSLPGAILNNTAFTNVKKVELIYSGTGVIRYGTDKTVNKTLTLNNHSSLTAEKYDLVSDAAYLSIEAVTSSLTVSKLTIFTDEEDVATTTTKSTNDKRIAATTFNGALVDGVSYVDVPTKITISGSKYTVNSTKRYTYYSWDYVQEHYTELDLDSIAITDPVDIANYYQAFGSVPANFYNVTNDASGFSWSDVSESIPASLTDVKAIFGTNTRGASLYNRTGGYADSVPSNSPNVYIEFDFDGDGTYWKNPSASKPTRGTNRVVSWYNGWTNRGSDIVSVYTDDHYATFKEYLNYGVWGESFAADTKYHRLITTCGTPTTLTKA